MAGLNTRRLKPLGEPPAALGAVVAWYFGGPFSKLDEPGAVPFYCDPRSIGRFAVPSRDLAGGSEPALFRLFVALSVFQGLRDVVVMKRQRMLVAFAADSLASLAAVRQAVGRNDCPMLRSPDAFDAGCSVAKDGDSVDCGQRPGARCHVKDARRRSWRAFASIHCEASATWIGSRPFGPTRGT